MAHLLRTHSDSSDGLGAVLNELRDAKGNGRNPAGVRRGLGNDRKKVRATWWAAYNAVTEHLSYRRGKTADTRLESLWFGEGYRINEDALDVALQMAT